MPACRPNTMNSYGIVLQDIGFGPFIDEFLLGYLGPLLQLVYPGRAEATGLDSHHSFLVQYKLHEDRKLDFHYDDADVTLNVCLGATFAGGDLLFSGLLTDDQTHTEDLRVPHIVGTCYRFDPSLMSLTAFPKKVKG